MGNYCDILFDFSKKNGGRATVICVVDELVFELNVLIASNIEAIKRLELQIKKAKSNLFLVPKSRIETTFLINQMHDELAYLKKLDNVCRHNLNACLQRKKEIKA